MVLFYPLRKFSLYFANIKCLHQGIHNWRENFINSKHEVKLLKCKNSNMVVDCRNELGTNILYGTEFSAADF